MKVALALVENFEIVEAMTPLDILKRGNIEVDIFSVFNEEYVKSSSNVLVKVDKKFDEVNFYDYNMIILPGGQGTSKYNENKKFLEEIIKFKQKNKKISAICAAPSILANIGVLKKGTCFPSVVDVLIDNKVEYIDEAVVIDENIITARSVANSLEFSLCLVEVLKGKEMRVKVEKEIILI